MCMQPLLCWFRTVTPIVQLNVQHVYLVETVIKYKVWRVGSRLALNLRSSNEHNTVIGCAVMTLAVVLLLLLSSSPSSNSKNQKPNEKKTLLCFVICCRLSISVYMWLIEFSKNMFFLMLCLCSSFFGCMLDVLCSVMFMHLAVECSWLLKVSAAWICINILFSKLCGVCGWILKTVVPWYCMQPVLNKKWRPVV